MVGPLFNDYNTVGFTALIDPGAPQLPQTAFIEARPLFKAHTMHAPAPCVSDVQRARCKMLQHCGYQQALRAEKRSLSPCSPRPLQGKHAKVNQLMGGTDSRGAQTPNSPWAMRLGFLHRQCCLGTAGKTATVGVLQGTLPTW